MNMMGIEKLARKYPNQISGGEKQRCAIARALASGNSIILADEPTGALDSENSKNVIEILKQVNKLGKTVIVVTHDINVANATNRIVKLKDGRIVE